MMREGFSAIALAAMPTFTNPNNISIVTGVAPVRHGVSGNFYLDRKTGRDVMMVDGASLRVPTILAEFSRLRAKVVAITAKDKLRKALGRGLDGIAFSAEAAETCTVGEHGIAGVPEVVGRPAPTPYSADLSLFVLDAGISLLESRPLDILYLSLSDYVQHKHGPYTPEASAFMSAVDRRLGRLLELGAVIGIVADHGMSDMANVEGNPRLLFLGDRLDAEFGPGVLRVICPITDPFVRHHGALGGFVRLHFLTATIDLDRLLAFLRELPEVELALPRAEACARFEPPEEHEGDIAVIARPGIAIGARASEHDLSQLAGARLRSHGGLAERRVPFILSHRVDASYRHNRPETLRNYDIFDFVLNGV
jgi:phosphonoacetate hydrolase